MTVTRIPPERNGLSSDAVVAANTTYVTVIPTNETDTIVGSDIRTQTTQCLRNLQSALKQAGSDLESLAHLTIYLTDIARDREGFNEVYREVFAGLPVPVRCAVGVAALARPEFLVELTAVAERQ
ncbi:RidA family protein (plasmid) [Arthrobacter sp. KN11-1C]|uniref:RidA family protein n=1 Tax=Arthrobacter sp. KN11-1C TaxID=3445774 RepID=UPI003F9F4457